MADNVVVESRLKDLVKNTSGEDFRVSGDFAAALDAKVRDIVTEAVHRAKTNGRKTVQAHDL